jgi:mannose-1-phosphate guanylyltransferase
VRALLLAAGLGTRLRPLTNSVPKCLVRINGIPLVDYWFDLLLRSSIERVLLNTHHLADVVRSHVLQSPWRERIDLAHEASLLGTGGTILGNAGYFKQQPFLVAHADNLTQFDVERFVERHAKRPAGTEITMMTFHTCTPQLCGIVQENEAGVVTGFHEKIAKPPTGKANAAVYIFEPEILLFLASLGKPVIDLSTEVIPHFLGKICTFTNTVYHRDIGTLDSLEVAQREFPGAAFGMQSNSKICNIADVG